MKTSEMKHCYQCDKETTELSPRSRCLTCEYKRSLANEAENVVLRNAIEVLKDFAQSVGGSSSFWEDYWPQFDPEEILKC